RTGQESTVLRPRHRTGMIHSHDHEPKPTAEPVPDSRDTDGRRRLPERLDSAAPAALDHQHPLPLPRWDEVAGIEARHTVRPDLRHRQFPGPDNPSGAAP